jgi:hypothetical protein
MMLQAMGGPMKKMLTAIFWGAILFPAAGGAATNFECRGKEIAYGSTRAEVGQRCGEPAIKDSWEEEVVEPLDRGLERRIFLTVEEWAYNLGPHRFVRILKFQNGKLIGIRAAGYGSDEDQALDPICDCPRGSTRIEVRIKCGDPDSKEVQKEEIIQRLEYDSERKFMVTTEEWSYNPGPNRFLRTLKFINGRLVNIRTGEYGY